jgi:hypothetical protein
LPLVTTEFVIWSSESSLVDPPGHTVPPELHGIVVERVINDGCELCLAGWITQIEAPDHLARRMGATFRVLGCPLARMN